MRGAVAVVAVVAVAVVVCAAALGVVLSGCAHDGPLALLPWLRRFDTPESVVGVPTIDGYRYIVPVDGGVVLVDVGFAPPTPSEVAELRGRRVLAVFITHAHLDHFGAIGAYEGVPIYIGADELPVAKHAADFRAPLQRLFRAFVPFDGLPRSVHSVDDGAVVVVGGRMFTALFMPGHTRGSTAWLSKRTADAGGAADADTDAAAAADADDSDVWLFAGDALFGGGLDGAGEAGIPPSFVSDDDATAIRSLERLRAHPFRVMFDGHGGRTLDVWRKLPRVIVDETHARL